MPVSNNSTLPLVTTPFTNASLSSISFNNQDILEIINSSNINKAHGYDDISRRLLKILCTSIVKPLSIIFKSSLQNGSFPNNWKKSNVSIDKKVDKQLLQNYQPVSLLPICGKTLERITFNPVFEYLEKNSVVCPNQSNFRPFDSYENQLLSIAHVIYAHFNQHSTLEMKANFLDISKTFDKVWHEGLLFKLERIGISGNILSLLTSFLSNRFQQVVPNGLCSSWWSSVLTRVPQGCILRTFFFLIYINDLPENLQSTVKLFADDTSLFSTVYDPNISASQPQSDIKKCLI